MINPLFRRSPSEIYNDFRKKANEWWSMVMLSAKITRSAEGKNPQDQVQLSVPQQPGEQAATMSAPRCETWGDIQVPPNNCPTMVLRSAFGGWGFPLADPRHRPDIGKRGDRGLFCDVSGNLVYLHGSQSATPEQIDIVHKTGSAEKFKQDGTITIDSATGKDVVVNAGTKQVARVDDQADCGSLTISTVQVSVVPPILGVQVLYTEPGSGVGTVVLQINIPGGVAVIPPIGPPLIVPIKAIITTGAPNFKG